MSYTSLGGEPYRAWLVLPIDFRADRKYPLVVWVYPIPQPEQQPELTSIATLNALNLQVLAAKGYAVLLPSMTGAAARYDRLLDGVLPAIDKAIASGIADSERLAVMGQSYGGFSTYGLITLTTRFKAAAALAGMTDWTSLALGFNPSLPATRPYRNALGVSAGRLNIHEFFFKYGLPWRSNAYLVNSPLTYVDRVQTPLLMLHGDFDGAMIQQAEEFYTALERLGKRSRLVKYYGDDHVLQSPANIKDSWQQILSWFDEFCDVARDGDGNLVFDGDRVRSRHSAGPQ
jgi:dipeptidyl aminopeptidase/acylaminoacyl peptidase